MKASRKQGTAGPVVTGRLPLEGAYLPAHYHSHRFEQPKSNPYILILTLKSGEKSLYHSLMTNVLPFEYFGQ